MNKKGLMGLTIVLSIFIFLIGMVTINYLKIDLTAAVSASGLDCDNNSISHGNMLTCLVVDLVLPYFFLLIISLVGGGLISAILK